MFHAMTDTWTGYTHNPLGFNVLSSQNPTDDLNYWQRLRPHAMLFTQQTFALAKSAQDTIPELEVCILRTVLDNDGEKVLHHGGVPAINQLLQDFLALVDYQHLDLARTYLYVMNEPDVTGGETPGILTWLIDCMRRARAYGVHCVVGNFGMATIPRARVDSGLFDGLLTEFSDQWHVFGCDEHAGPVPSGGAGGRAPDMYLDKALAQQEYWPSPYDVQAGSINGNWHIGRVFWWLARCDALGIPRPRILLCEIGCDRMGDLESATLTDGRRVNIYQELEQRYRHEELIDGQFLTLNVPWPHETMRGVDTLRWVWADYYPQWTFGQTHMRFTEWQLWVYCDWQTGKPAIEAALEYAHCPGHDEWDRRYGEHATGDAEYRLLTLAYAAGILDAPKPPDPKPPAVPLVSPLVALVIILITVLSAVLVTVFSATHRTFDFITQGAQTMLGAEIFKSKRFWSAMIGIVLMVAVSFVPSLANDAETLQRGIEIIVGLLIGGYTIEQTAQAWRK